LGDSMVFEANYLENGSLVSAYGYPKIVLYRTSPSSPLVVDNGAGYISYSVVNGGTVYLDVSSKTSVQTGEYRVVVHRVR
jgi:hypothetical protein